MPLFVPPRLTEEQVGGVYHRVPPVGRLSPLFAGFPDLSSREHTYPCSPSMILFVGLAGSVSWAEAKALVAIQEVTEVAVAVEA